VSYFAQKKNVVFAEKKLPTCPSQRCFWFSGNYFCKGLKVTMGTASEKQPAEGWNSCIPGSNDNGQRHQEQDNQSQHRPNPEIAFLFWSGLPNEQSAANDPGAGTGCAHPQTQSIVFGFRCNSIAGGLDGIVENCQRMTSVRPGYHVVDGLSSNFGRHLPSAVPADPTRDNCKDRWRSYGFAHTVGRDSKTVFIQLASHAGMGYEGSFQGRICYVNHFFLC